MDGLYYNRIENVLVFTQDINVCDKYYKGQQIGRLSMVNNIDKAVGFYIYSNGVKWELVEGMFNTWTILKNDEVEVENCTYRRAMQIIINRIGAGDVY